MAVPNDPLTDFGHDLSDRNSKKRVQIILLSYSCSWSIIGQPLFKLLLYHCYFVMIRRRWSLSWSTLMKDGISLDTADDDVITEADWLISLISYT